MVKKETKKILVAGLELDELEKTDDITKFDIEYYLPMDEDEALREQIRIPISVILKTYNRKKISI